MVPGREEDRLVLQQLKEHGDVGVIPRPVFIWIYGTVDDLGLIAPALASKGWLGVEPEPSDGQWVIRAQREQQTTDLAIFVMVEEIYEAMKDTAADFDGWETSVERDN